MKKQLIIILAVLVTIMGIATFLILSQKRNNPPTSVIDPKNTIELYEELSSNEVQKIMITTVNVNVRVIKSDNNNVRIIYKPFTDEKSFKYELVDGVLTLSVNEVESRKFLIPTDSELIYVYIPKTNAIDFYFETGSGFIDVDEVNLKSIEVKSTSGIVALSDCIITEGLSVNDEYGKVALRNVVFKQLKIDAVSALISCSLAELVDGYVIDSLTNRGDITVNGVASGNSFVLGTGEENTENPVIVIRSKTGNISLSFLMEENQ